MEHGIAIGVLAVAVACGAGCADSHGARSTGAGQDAGAQPADAGDSREAGGDAGGTTGASSSSSTTGDSTSTSGTSSADPPERVSPACPESADFGPCDPALQEWHALSLVLDRDVPENGARVLAVTGPAVLLGDEAAGRYWVTDLGPVADRGADPSTLDYMELDTDAVGAGVVPRAVWTGYSEPLVDLVEGARMVVLACDTASACHLLVSDGSAPPALHDLQVPADATGLVGDRDALCVLADDLHCLVDGTLRVELEAQQGGPFVDATVARRRVALTEGEVYQPQSGSWQPIAGIEPHASPHLGGVGDYVIYRTREQRLVLGGPGGHEICDALGPVVLGALTLGARYPTAWALDTDGRLLQHRGSDGGGVSWCVAASDYPTQWDDTSVHQCGAGTTLLGVREGQLWGVVGEPRCIYL